MPAGGVVGGGSLAGKVSSEAASTLRSRCACAVFSSAVVDLGWLIVASFPDTTLPGLRSLIARSHRLIVYFFPCLRAVLFDSLGLLIIEVGQFVMGAALDAQ